MFYMTKVSLTLTIIHAGGPYGGGAHPGATHSDEADCSRGDRGLERAVACSEDCSEGIIFPIPTG